MRSNVGDIVLHSNEGTAREFKEMSPKIMFKPPKSQFYESVETRAKRASIDAMSKVNSGVTSKASNLVGSQVLS